MKKISGCIDVRALGCHNFEFYVDDNTTKEEIEKMVEDKCDYFISYDIEEGYEPVQIISYRKRGK